MDNTALNKRWIFHGRHYSAWWPFFAGLRLKKADGGIGLGGPEPICTNAFKVPRGQLLSQMSLLTA
eukprot:scaffold648749_cov48-Prasinocladus_malaysianus.AAC.1